MSSKGGTISELSPRVMSNSDEVKKLKKQIEKLEAECADVLANKEKIQKQNEIFAKELNKMKKEEGVKETPLDKKKEEEQVAKEIPPSASEINPVASREVDSVAIIKLKKAEKELEEIKKLADNLKEENKSLKTKNASMSNVENSQNKESSLKAKEAPALTPTPLSSQAANHPTSSPVKGDKCSDILKDMTRLFSERNDLTGGLKLQPSIFLRLLKTYAKESDNDVIISLEDLSSCLLSFMIKITTEQLDVHIQIIHKYLFTIYLYY